MDSHDRHAVETCAGHRLGLLLTSWQRLTSNLLEVSTDALWRSSKIVLAHDTSDPPIFFYGNRAALTLFRMKTRDFLGLPSYRSAEEGHRAERARMFAQLEAHDLVTDYRGVRIAADGTRFLIEDAVIWNLRDEDGRFHGQAAAFDRITFL